MDSRKYHGSKMMFKDRINAGKELAKLLEPLKGKDPIVLGLPRGGVPVAFEVAKALNKSLDVIIVRKLGVPWQRELAFGAIGEGGEEFLNQTVIVELEISHQMQSEVKEEEVVEIAKRQVLFRENHQPIDLRGRTVIIVDDGIATGSTIQVACKVARTRGAREIIVAVPVATKEAVRNLRSIADECYVIQTPDDFMAVGEWYEDFSQTTDEKVIEIMKESRIKSGN